MKILVANVGSTSFKYQLLEMTDESVLARGSIQPIGSETCHYSHQTRGHSEVSGTMAVADYEQALRWTMERLQDPATGAVSSLQEVAAVGFKTVHGGEITGCVPLTDEVLVAMANFTPVAPAHNPPYIAAIRLFRALFPELPLFGLFEPTFHQTLPDFAFIYGVPYAWYQQHGIRRYGFHGASHAYIAERTPQIIGGDGARLRIVSCHLGGSSSVCAIRAGRSIDTSMGFSPQSGLLNVSRTGDLDPFVIPYIMDREGLDTDGIRRVLCVEGGLRGISGLSGDMRDLEQATDQGHQRARLAIKAFCYGVKKYIGAYAAALGGLDVVAFTGGIGEQSPRVRGLICEGLAFLNLRLDAKRNERLRGREGFISVAGASIPVLVIPAHEELVVARQVARRVAQQGEQAS